MKLGSRYLCEPQEVLRNWTTVRVIDFHNWDLIFIGYQQIVFVKKYNR